MRIGAMECAIGKIDKATTDEIHRMRNKDVEGEAVVMIVTT